MMIRVVFLVLLAQQLSWHAADAAYFDFMQTTVIDSCKNFGITSETLEEACVEHCYPNTIEIWDYADVGEDPNYVIRNTVCRCMADGESPSAPRRKVSECWTKAEVWDKSKPVMSCEEDYGIVSISTCQEYCKKLDPKAFSFQGFSGSSECSCGDVQVCNDNPVGSSATQASATIATTVLGLVAGCVLAL